MLSILPQTYRAVPNIDHTYPLPSARTLKRKLDELTICGQNLQSKFYNSNKKFKRLHEKVENLKTRLVESLEKSSIEDSTKDCIIDAAKNIPERLLQSSSLKPHEFHPIIRRFALTLHFYSPKAYRLLRETFNNTLPCESTLYKWCSKLDAEPGFTEQSFQFIKKKVEEEKAKGKDLLFSLSFDEMKLMKNLQFNGEKFVGCVDFGFECGDQSDGAEEATDVSVFMLNVLNSNWKLPLGYFFIKSTTASQNENLVRICLQKLHEVGATVCSVACDGPSTHINMAKRLGVSFELTNLNSLMANLTSQSKTFFILDPAHMIKLVRNCFGDLKTFIKDGKTISWKYVEELYKLQTDRGLYLCNKLSTQHIYYHDTKMKVKFATQLFSNSVADAIDFARDVLKLQQFEGSEETTTFLRIINDGFDLQNSQKMRDKGFKSPITTENQAQFETRIQEITCYLHALETSSGQKLVKSRRFTGFVGFLINFKSLLGIYEEYVVNGPLKYLLFNKCSQDYLEHFFGRLV